VLQCYGADIDFDPQIVGLGETAEDVAVDWRG
jgi:hypothetical protein